MRMSYDNQRVFSGQNKLVLSTVLSWCSLSFSKSVNSFGRRGRCEQPMSRLFLALKFPSVASDDFAEAEFPINAAPWAIYRTLCQTGGWKCVLFTFEASRWRLHKGESPRNKTSPKTWQRSYFSHLKGGISNLFVPPRGVGKAHVT